MAIQQKVAFITNAATPMGMYMSETLLSKGWFVFAGYIGQEPELLNNNAKMSTENRMTLQIDLVSEAGMLSLMEQVSHKKKYIDLLIHHGDEEHSDASANIREHLEFDQLEYDYDTNALGMIRITNALLELLNRGSMKRLCFFTSSAASINSTRKTSDYGYAMSMAARNMGITILYNKLVSEGYTFRVCSREINVTNSSVDLEAYKVDASSALAYFLRDRYVDRHNASRCDEHRLVIRDQQGRECPW